MPAHRIDVTDPEPDARVAAVLVALHTRLTEPPDEVVAARHLEALRTATAARRVGWQVLARAGAAVAAAVIVLLVLAGGGLLPHAAQRTVADGAQRIGVTPPRPAAEPATAPPADASGPVDNTEVERHDPDPARDEARDPGAGGGDPAAEDPGSMRAPTASRGHGPDLDERALPPRWDLMDRPPSSRRGATVEHPDEPGPPAVDPPAPVPTPTPDGTGAPRSQQGQDGDDGPGSPDDRHGGPPTSDPPDRSQQRSDRAQDARPQDRPPPGGGRGR